MGILLGEDIIAYSDVFSHRMLLNIVYFFTYQISESRQEKNRSFKAPTINIIVHQPNKLQRSCTEKSLLLYLCQTDYYINELCEKINAFDEESLNFQGSREVGTSGYLKIVPFSAKEKSPEFTKTQAFL